MPIFDNITGAQWQVGKPFDNIAGVWREDNKVWDNINGVWRETHSSVIAWKNPSEIADFPNTPEILSTYQSVYANNKIFTFGSYARTAAERTLCVLIYDFSTNAYTVSNIYTSECGSSYDGVIWGACAVLSGNYVYVYFNSGRSSRKAAYSANYFGYTKINISTNAIDVPVIDSKNLGFDQWGYTALGIHNGELYVVGNGAYNVSYAICVYKINLSSNICTYVTRFKNLRNITTNAGYKGCVYNGRLYLIHGVPEGSGCIFETLNLSSLDISTLSMPLSNIVNDYIQPSATVLIDGCMYFNDTNLGLTKYDINADTWTQLGFSPNSPRQNLVLCPNSIVATPIDCHSHTVEQAML